MIPNGTVIGGTYEVVGLIGCGGSGHVYACKSAANDRKKRADKPPVTQTMTHSLSDGKTRSPHFDSQDIRWAVKEAHTEDVFFTGKEQEAFRNASCASEKSRRGADTFRAEQSLHMEVELLKGLRHRSLVNVVDVIRGETGLLMVMDYVRGKSLDQVLREKGALTEKEVIRIGLQIADVLGYLHSRGQAVIYRDLKPSNLIMCEDSRVVLVDFGAVFTASNDFSIMKLAFGTRGYAAPEQYSESAELDAATDVYAFGRTLIALLTGGSTRMSKLRGVSPGLKRVLKRCTRKNKTERYASIAEVYQELKDLQDNGSLKRQLSVVKLLLFTGALISAVVFSIDAMANAEASKYPALVFGSATLLLWLFWRIPALILSLTGVTTRRKIKRQQISAVLNGTFQPGKGFQTGEHSDTMQALSWDDIEISLDDEIKDLRIDIDSNRVHFAGMEDFVMEQDAVITNRESYRTV